MVAGMTQVISACKVAFGIDWERHELSAQDYFDVALCYESLHHFKGHVSKSQSLRVSLSQHGPDSVRQT